MFVIITQLVLLLCAWCTQTYDIATPEVNFLIELEKIKNFQERVKTTETTIEELNRETGVLKTTVQTLQDKVELQQNENEVLKTTVQTLQDKVELQQNENEARKVAFSASLLASGQGHDGPNDSVLSPLIYKKVFTNIGNGYNSDTEAQVKAPCKMSKENPPGDWLSKQESCRTACNHSELELWKPAYFVVSMCPAGNNPPWIFTAPVKGVYYFRFYAHSHIGTKMAVSLYKNGNIQCSVFSLKPVTNGNASNGIALTLEKGDQIYTRLWNNSWVYDDPQGYTSFGGFLLFPL